MAAAAINYGDTGSGSTLGPGYNHGNSSSGFSGSMDLNDRRQEWHDIVKTVWDSFETIPFYEMSPHPDPVNNGYCLAEPGRQYLVYLETQGAVNVALTGGAYRVLWIDAQRPEHRIDGGKTADGRRLETPAGGDDWMPYLTHMPGTR